MANTARLASGRGVTINRSPRYGINEQSYLNAEWSKSLSGHNPPQMPLGSPSVIRVKTYGAGHMAVIQHWPYGMSVLTIRKIVFPDDIFEESVSFETWLFIWPTLNPNDRLAVETAMCECAEDAEQDFDWRDIFQSITLAGGLVQGGFENDENI